MLRGATGGGDFGRDLTGGADLTGDGILDVAISAPREDSNGADSGTIRLLSVE